MRRFLLLGLVLTLLSGPAVAIMTIASDTFQITDANGTVLMDVNGMPAAGSLSETDEPAGSFGTLTFGLTGTISAPVSAGLQEPGSVGLLGLSDSVFITQQPQSHLSVSFSSDGEGSGQICDPAVGGPNTCITETGQLQDLTPLLFSEESPPFHVKIQSDTEVPEPGTLLLLGAGLASLAVFGRTRRRMNRGPLSVLVGASALFWAGTTHAVTCVPSAGSDFIKIRVPEALQFPSGHQRVSPSRHSPGSAP